ncbi:thioesterase domain-containing protein [Photobacterium damselae subsp. piscicida]|nr:thioesterase domain-containing protein [Photobacterium damselae subsp. piscicida]
MAAVRVISRINTELGAQLTVGQLQSHDTIERLASILEQQFGDDGSSPVLLTSAEHQLPALFIVHPIGGHLLSYQPLAQHLSQVSLYGLAFPNMETDQESWDVQQLAQYYIEQIRDIQPHGPYRLAGWSFGGIVAYEMAYQLTQQSLEVEACILIDSYKPTTRKEAMSAQEIRHHFYADVIGRFRNLLKRIPQIYRQIHRFVPIFPRRLAKSPLSMMSLLIAFSDYSTYIATTYQPCCHMWCQTYTQFPLR